MFVKNFIIPLNRKDLLTPSSNDNFYVEEEYDIISLGEKLEFAKTALNEEGIDFIIEHFSCIFSLLQKFKQCSQNMKEKGWKILKKSFNILVKSLGNLFEDVSCVDSELQWKMCNITKMIVYTVLEFMKSHQDENIKQNNKVLEGKPRKKLNKVINEESDWAEEKRLILIEVHSFLLFPLKLLWEPPVVDEDFVNLIGNFCYNCLEDPMINSINAKSIKETIFQILGVLINNYLHGLSFCVKVVQLLKTNDHLVNALSYGVTYLVQECNCNFIVKEIVREVADTDGDQLAVDISGTRNLNLFIVQLAESVPKAIIPAIDLLITHLNGDSYSMRICVVGVLGEIVLSILTKENLDDNYKTMRDEYLNCLEEHIHDVNAFVRTKVLQTWQKLCLGKAIPVSRINGLLELVIGRLNDKSTNVKKQAVHLIRDLLEGNPFCGQLNCVEIQNQLQQEKKKLEQITNSYISKTDIDKWEEIKNNLHKIICTVDQEKDSSIIEKDFESVDVLINSIGNYLLSGEYEKAIKMTLSLKNEFCKLYNIEIENCVTESLIDILHKIYTQKSTSTLTISPEDQEKIEKHSVVIEYLENTLEFSKLIDLALPVILTFLDSNVTTDVLEAINFFSAAYLFGFTKALEGIRKMLHLIFSKESNIKTAVSNAYKDLYFQANGNERQKSLTTVENLSQLVLKLNFSQLEALEEVVKEWVKTEVIDKNIVQVIFEKFSAKNFKSENEKCWAALVLIRMIGSQEPKIIKNNFSILLNEGLKNRGSQNFFIAKETCKAFQFLVPPKEPGKNFDHSLRYSRGHEIFKILHNLLRRGIWKTDDQYFIPMAEEAINLVFRCVEEPDKFCCQLLYEIYNDILSKKLLKSKKSNDVNILHFDNYNDFNYENEDYNNLKYNENDLNEENIKDVNEIIIILLTRFISILGQVAANYIKYLEGPILDELKLRNQLEYEKKLRKIEENKKFNISIRKNKILGCNESKVDKIMNDTNTEDLEFNKVAADDMDIDEMKKRTENEIVKGTGFLAKFVPLILTICKNPGKYNNKPLQNASLITLSKFMQVSSTFCDENLQLLVTICEKSQIRERQENAIIALGALQYRFPNNLEPWTPHMYGMLQNSNSSVRYNSILILTDLIVNEMIKVRSHISSLAVCVVDQDIKIARVARHFFREYSQKGNSLYNVLPSLISNLTQSESQVSSDKFKIIMKFILSLVTKEKQFEYLVEKICQYFESATTERQWCDLAYCLSLLSYGEKSFKKIYENVKSFAGKMYLAEVYEAFCTIITDAGKNNQKDKSIVNEFQEIVKEYRDKCCVNKSENFTENKKTSFIPCKKKLKKKKYLPSDSEDEKDEEEGVILEENEEIKSATKNFNKRKHESNKKNIIHYCNEERDSEDLFEKENENNDSNDDSDDFFRKDIKKRNKKTVNRKGKRIYALKNSSEEEEDEKEIKLKMTNYRKKKLRSS